jgi:glucose-1-phosphate adenylyltransferase
VAAIPVDKSQAAEFGVIEAAPDGRIVGFHEKNPNAPSIPGDPTRVYASMGNYVFSTRALLRELYDDAANPDSNHDFGRDILPSLVGRGEMFAYDFQTNQIPGEPAGAPVYWRDVGTIDAYYEANMDLRAVSPALNLYNREWPLRTASYADAPAKFTFDDEDRRGQAIDSIVSGACILSGGMVRNSVLFRGVRVHSGALVEDSIILDNCDVGRRAKVQRAILDKNVRIPPDAEIGYNLEHDRRYHHVTESGIVVMGGNRSSVEVSTLFV